MQRGMDSSNVQKKKQLAKHGYVQEAPNILQNIQQENSKRYNWARQNPHDKIPPTTVSQNQQPHSAFKYVENHNRAGRNSHIWQ